MKLLVRPGSIRGPMIVPDLAQGRELLEFDEGQLYTLLAQGSAEYAEENKLYFSPRAFGEQMFKRLVPKLESVICPRYCKERHHWVSEDGAEAVLIIFGWIEEHFVGFPVLTLSAIVVKRGVKTLCPCV